VPRNSPAPENSGTRSAIRTYPPKHPIVTIAEQCDVANAEKLRAERMKVELITNVSHDIRTPLTSTWPRRTSQLPMSHIFHDPDGT